VSERSTLRLRPVFEQVAGLAVEGFADATEHVGRNPRDLALASEAVDGRVGHVEPLRQLQRCYASGVQRFAKSPVNRHGAKVAACSRSRNIPLAPCIRTRYITLVPQRERVVGKRITNELRNVLIERARDGLAVAMSGTERDPSSEHVERSAYFKLGQLQSVLSGLVASLETGEMWVGGRWNLPPVDLLWDLAIAEDGSPTRDAMSETNDPDQQK
jgi:hypothetical protein